MKIKDFGWIVSVGILYLLSFIASRGNVYFFLALLPFLLTIFFYFPNIKSVFNLKVYGFINLYLISMIIFSITNSYSRSVVVFIVLMLYNHAMIGGDRISLRRLNHISRIFAISILILYFGTNFIPLLIKYPYTIGSWYKIASEEIPTISTTLDGPFLLIILVIYSLLILRNNYKKIHLGLLNVIFLIFAFSTLLVYNRRVLLLVYFILIIIMIYDLGVQRKYVVGVFSATFLTPLFFGAILAFAFNVLSIPEIQNLTLRTGDLDPESNQRLYGWNLAITEFQNLSFRDFFGFHKVLMRSNIDRFNHFHNGYIQMIYEQGIFGITVLILLIIQVIKRVKYYSFIDLKKYRYLAVFPIIFTIILLISITESTYRRLSVTNLIFIVSCFMIIKTTESIKNNTFIED